MLWLLCHVHNFRLCTIARRCQIEGFQGLNRRFGDRVTFRFGSGRFSVLHIQRQVLDMECYGMVGIHSRRSRLQMVAGRWSDFVRASQTEGKCFDTTSRYWTLNMVEPILKEFWATFVRKQIGPNVTTGRGWSENSLRQIYIYIYMQGVWNLCEVAIWNCLNRDK